MKLTRPIRLLFVLCLTACVFPATAAQAKSARCFDRKPTIVGTDNNDQIKGTPKSDVILAKHGSDTISSGGGKDFVCAFNGTDIVFGGRGADRINGGPDTYARYQEEYHNQLYGGPGDDVIEGGADEDYLYGGSGDDRMTGTSRAGDEFYPGLGNDVLIGGGREELNEQSHAESDIAVYRGLGQPIRANVARGVVKAQGTDVLKGVGSVEGTRFDDVLLGDAYHNILVGWAGDDVIRSRGTRDDCPFYDTKCGSDIIWAGPGNDEIHGSALGKTWVAFRSDSALQIDLAQGSAVGEGEDELHEVSMVAVGLDVVEYQWACPDSPTQSTVVGDDERNVFYVRCTGNFLLQGLGAYDTINADAAIATVEGGEGDDFLAGEFGETSLFGGPGDDFLAISEGEPNDRADGGAGTDRCLADPGEVVVNCESESGHPSP